MVGVVWCGGRGLVWWEGSGVVGGVWCGGWDLVWWVGLSFPATCCLQEDSGVTAAVANLCAGAEEEGPRGEQPEACPGHTHPPLTAVGVFFLQECCSQLEPVTLFWGLPCLCL